MPHAAWLRDRRRQDHQRLSAAGAACDPCRRAGLARRQRAARTSCLPPAIAARSSSARQHALPRLPFRRFRPASIVSRPTARRGIAVATVADALAAAPARDTRHLLLLLRGQRPACMKRQWLPSAALVPTDAPPLHSLRLFRGRGPMNSRQLLARAGCRRAAAGGCAAGSAPKAPSIFPPARISTRTSSRRSPSSSRTRWRPARSPAPTS